MGFHIPDSPLRRDVASAASQTTRSSQTAPASADAGLAESDAATFRQRFSQRRRNALIPTLSVDVVGSPRSPFVCLSRGHRLALSRQRLREQAQQTTAEFHVDNDIENSEQATKRTPSIRRRSVDALAPSRAALNVFETP